MKDMTKTERYRVRYILNGERYSDAPTDDLSMANQRKSYLRDRFGTESVWIEVAVEGELVGWL